MDDIDLENVQGEFLMSKELYLKTHKFWRSRLQAKGDATPRFMAAGKGDPFATCFNVKDALEKHPNSRPVRGYKLLWVQLHNGEYAIKAVFHMVVAHPPSLGLGKTTSSKNENFECVTAHYIEERDKGKGFVFVPSSRAHANLTDKEIMSGQWCMGIVIIASDLFANELISHMEVQGRMKSIMAKTPESCLAKRNVITILPAVMGRWISKRFPQEDEVALAELMGMPTEELTTNTSNISNGLAFVIQNAYWVTVSDWDTASNHFNSLVKQVCRDSKVQRTDIQLLDGIEILSLIVHAQARSVHGQCTKEEAEMAVFEFLDAQHEKLQFLMHKRMLQNAAIKQQKTQSFQSVVACAV